MTSSDHLRDPPAYYSTERPTPCYSEDPRILAVTWHWTFGGAVVLCRGAFRDNQIPMSWEERTKNYTAVGDGRTLDDIYQTLSMTIGHEFCHHVLSGSKFDID